MMSKSLAGYLSASNFGKNRLVLIQKMAEENHLWGAERIRGELLKLGIEVSKRTIQRYGLESPFAALKSLEYGDQIIAHMGGVKYIYEIQTSRMLRPYSTSFAFESQQDHSCLTLITYQEYIPQNETYRFRRVV